MAVPEKQKKYNAKNIKRVPLDMQISDYEILLFVVKSQGNTVNGYIKTAIKEKIERDTSISNN